MGEVAADTTRIAISEGGVVRCCISTVRGTTSDVAQVGYKSLEVYKQCSCCCLYIQNAAVYAMLQFSLKLIIYAMLQSSIVEMSLSNSPPPFITPSAIDLKVPKSTKCV